MKIMPLKPCRTSGAAAVVLLTPTLANANLSHVSGGGALLLSILVLAALASIPTFAAVTAERGRRLANFALVLGVWILLVLLAIGIPTGKYGGESDSAITKRILFAAAALFASIVVRRLYRRFVKKASASSGITGKES